MKVKLILNLPRVDNETEFRKNAYLFGANISNTWDWQGVSPFIHLGIPHTNDTYYDLDIRLLVHDLTHTPSQRFNVRDWRVSGKFRSKTYCAEPSVVVLEIIPDSLCISNSKLGYENVPVRESENFKVVREFVTHLLLAGWIDEGNNFQKFRCSAEKTSAP